MVDLSSVGERRAVVREVSAAFRDSGFLCVVDRGISEELYLEL